MPLWWASMRSMAKWHLRRAFKNGGNPAVRRRHRYGFRKEAGPHAPRCTANARTPRVAGIALWIPLGEEWTRNGTNRARITDSDHFTVRSRTKYRQIKRLFHGAVASWQLPKLADAVPPTSTRPCTERRVICRDSRSQKVRARNVFLRIRIILTRAPCAVDKSGRGAKQTWTKARSKDSPPLNSLSFTPKLLGARRRRGTTRIPHARRFTPIGFRAE